MEMVHIYFVINFTNNLFNSGNVPPVFTPGNDSYSSWNKIDANNPRNFGGQLDYIVMGHGTNDGLNNRPASAVQAAAYAWLVAQRAISLYTILIIFLFVVLLFTVRGNRFNFNNCGNSFRRLRK